MPEAIQSDINFRQIVANVWIGRWWIIASTVLVTGIVIIGLLFAANKYTSTTLLAPSQSNTQSSIGSLAAQYGGLAQLAGVNLADMSNENATLGIEILRSRQFTQGFVEKHSLLVPLMASKSWDAESGSLLIDSDIFDEDSNEWVRDVTAPKSKVPSALEAYEEFQKIMSIERDNKTGFVRVGLTHESPVLASRWLTLLVEDLNNSVAVREIQKAERAMMFLQDELKVTSQSELKAVLFNLIEEQLKIITLARATDEYVFNVIDPPVVPEEHSWPNRPLFVIFAFILTFVGSVFAVLIFHRDDVES